MTKCIGRTASGKPIWSPLGEPYHLPDGYSPLTASEAIESGQRLAAALSDWSEQDHLDALRAMGRLRQETRDMQLGAACGLASVSHWFASATPTKLDESSGSRKEETKMEYKHEQAGENVCPECGSENPPRATVCAECGAQLDNEEADVEEAVEVCPHCKTPVYKPSRRHRAALESTDAGLQRTVPDPNPRPGARGLRAGSPPSPPSTSTLSNDGDGDADAFVPRYCTNCGAPLTGKRESKRPTLTPEEQEQFEAMSPLLSKAMRSMGLAMVPIEEVADPDGPGAGKRSTGYDNYGQYSDEDQDNSPTGVSNRLSHSPTPSHPLPPGQLAAAVVAVEQDARLVARDALAFSMPAGKFIVGKVRAAATGVIEANAGSDDETISEAVAGLRSVVATTDRALEAGSLDLDGCREVLRHLNVAIEALQANASVDVAEQASLPWNRPVAQEREETIARMIDILFGHHQILFSRFTSSGEPWPSPWLRRRSGALSPGPR